MPGPKMGPRPEDFNEELIRQAPAYKKWEALTLGDSMKYACRNFVKGCGDDEERLMRRIMIARRNNLKDHNVIKQMRAAEADSRGVDVEEIDLVVVVETSRTWWWWWGSGGEHGGGVGGVGVTGRGAWW